MNAADEADLAALARDLTSEGAPNGEGANFGEDAVAIAVVETR